MFYIYILYSEVSHIYYIGYTDNYQRRFEEHNHSERNTFTHKHRPWILKVVFECGGDESKAMEIERFIKAQKSKRFVENLITRDLFTGILSPLVRVPKFRD